MSGSTDRDLAASLSKWLSARRNEDVQISGLTLASAGARRTNALFDAVSATGTQRLALTLIPTAAIQVIDVTAEVGARALAESAGVPVPHVHDVCTDDTVIGGPFFISTAIDGETVPRRVLRLAKEHAIGDLIVAQIGEAMARLHGIDTVRAPDGIPRPEGAGPIATALAIVDRLLTDLLDPSPSFAHDARASRSTSSLTTGSSGSRSSTTTSPTRPNATRSPPAGQPHSRAGLD